MSGDESYAPRSPDLSSFYSSGPTQPASPLHPPSRGEHKLQPPASALASCASSPYAPPVRQHGHVEPVYRRYSPPTPQQRYLPPGSRLLVPPPAASPYGRLPPAAFLQRQPPDQPPDQPPPPLPSPPARPPQHHPQNPAPASPSASAQPDLAPAMPPRRAAAAAAAAATPPPAIEPSPVKTKFPTARIKRIMQADEEVGKVAQQTPIAVGKALELFMIQLVTRSADVAKDKGSKRITAPMLKHVVETDDQWDFLRDIVGRVEAEKEGSKAKSKAESESDDDMGEPKKRGRGGRRKRA